MSGTHHRVVVKERTDQGWVEVQPFYDFRTTPIRALQDMLADPRKVSVAIEHKPTHIDVQGTDSDGYAFHYAIGTVKVLVGEDGVEIGVLS